MNPEPLIEVDELRIAFPSMANGWETAVNGVTLAIGAGERVGLVGESGSGKSLTALACLGLVPEPGRITGGSVRVAGADVAQMSSADRRQLRGREIGIILQEAAEAFNPVYTVGFQVAEAVAVHRDLGQREAQQVAISLLSDAAIEAPEVIARSYPHELSGGQSQRAMLALALAGKPRVLIADEPTSALDVLTQAQVVDLLDALVNTGGMGLLLISHDLVVVEGIVDRVAIMHEGTIVEEGPTDGVFSSPRHPYTKMLLEAVPGRPKAHHAND